VLHRWVCFNICYNVEGLRSGNYGNTSADGVLRARGSVCCGYATLFSALCKEAGVEQNEVSGVAKGSMWESSASESLA
jgi:transglutaminase-like putative cysteine protease